MKFETSQPTMESPSSFLLPYIKVSPKNGRKPPRFPHGFQPFHKGNPDSTIHTSSTNSPGSDMEQHNPPPEAATQTTSLPSTATIRYGETKMVGFWVGGLDLGGKAFVLTKQMTLEFPPQMTCMKSFRNFERIQPTRFLEDDFLEKPSTMFHPFPSYESSKPPTLEIHSDPIISQKKTFPKVDRGFIVPQCAVVS